MKLLDDLRLSAEQTDSYFQRALLKEDIARIEKLLELAASNTDREALHAANLRLGWTPGDQRTLEIKPELRALADAIADAQSDPSTEAAVGTAWQVLVQVRMEKLVGCLAQRPSLDDY